MVSRVSWLYQFHGYARFTITPRFTIIPSRLFFGAGWLSRATHQNAPDWIQSRRRPRMANRISRFEFVVLLVKESSAATLVLVLFATNSLRSRIYQKADKLKPFSISNQIVICKIYWQIYWQIQPLLWAAIKSPPMALIWPVVQWAFPIRQDRPV